jgi:hypothetical protein
MALTKFKKMAGEDWRKSKLLHVISAFKKQKQSKAHHKH